MSDLLLTDPCPCGSGATFEACCESRLPPPSEHASTGPAMEPVRLSMGAMFGMTATFATRPVRCADPKCGRVVAVGEHCFFDADGRVWCHGCGKCERYSRKRAAERAASNR